MKTQEDQTYYTSTVEMKLYDTMQAWKEKNTFKHLFLALIWQKIKINTFQRMLQSHIILSLIQNHNYCWPVLPWREHSSLDPGRVRHTYWLIHSNGFFSEIQKITGFAFKTLLYKNTKEKLGIWFPTAHCMSYNLISHFFILLPWWRWKASSLDPGGMKHVYWLIHSY